MCGVSFWQQECSSSIYVPVLTKHRDNGSVATFCNIGPPSPSPPFSAPHQLLLWSQSQAYAEASTSSHQSTIHLHFSSSHGTGPLSDRILHFLNFLKGEISRTAVEEKRTGGWRLLLFSTKLSHSSWNNSSLCFKGEFETRVLQLQGDQKHWRLKKLFRLGDFCGARCTKRRPPRGWPTC